MILEWRQFSSFDNYEKKLTNEYKTKIAEKIDKQETIAASRAAYDEKGRVESPEVPSRSASAKRKHPDTSTAENTEGPSGQATTVTVEAFVVEAFRAPQQD